MEIAQIMNIPQSVILKASNRKISLQIFKLSQELGLAILLLREGLTSADCIRDSVVCVQLTLASKVTRLNCFVAMFDAVKKTELEHYLPMSPDMYEH